MKVSRALLAAAASCLLLGAVAPALAYFPNPTDNTTPYHVAVPPGGIALSNFVRLNATGAGTFKLAAEVGGKTVYVTEFHFQASAGTTIHFSYGTGSGCGTGLTQITDDYSATGSIDGIASTLPIFASTQGRAICAVVSGAMVGGMTYSQN